MRDRRRQLAAGSRGTGGPAYLRPLALSELPAGLQSGVILALMFAEGEGTTLADESARETDFELVGSPAWGLDDGYGPYVTFVAASSQHAKSANDIFSNADNDPGSVFVLCRIPNTSGNKYLYSCEGLNGGTLFFTTDFVRCYGNGSEFASATADASDTGEVVSVGAGWANGGTIIAYTNGSPSAPVNQTSAGNPEGTARPVTLASTHNGTVASSFLDCDIFAVLVWDRKLSDEEMAELHALFAE